MESSTAELECIVCLDLARVPVSCTVCRKLMCHMHIARLAQKCPNCRSEPLKYNQQEEIGKRVNEERAKRIRELPPDTKFKCQIAGCPYESHLNNMLLHHKYKHPETDLERMLYGQPAPEPEVDVPTEAEINKAQWLSSRPPRAPEGQRSKIPSYRLALKMARHVNECDNEQCRATWCGPWGTFLGGPTGMTHFDLTDCPVGKSLNLECGWNYDDPRN